ncbi:hypothetical protein HPB51_020589 [Rhipicephalus microplus]|uniref:Uncharacterized protein n=1 Tax=Rhipicephalus microplus TaxID=6941 RepID=A0A9J6DJ09_RHIMP|nr:hypothetical protein HPB51_020589 [Rhipicephalus microplus]
MEFKKGSISRLQLSTRILHISFPTRRWYRNQIRVSHRPPCPLLSGDTQRGQGSWTLRQRAHYHISSSSEWQLDVSSLSSSLTTGNKTTLEPQQLALRPSNSTPPGHVESFTFVLPDGSRHDTPYLSTIPTVPSDASEESRLSDQAVGDLPTTWQSLADFESASLNQSMSAEDRLMYYKLVLSASAHHALADGSDAPQAGEANVSTSGLSAYSPTWDHVQCNMTLRPSECYADHQEAVCVEEESEIDRPAGDQLAQSSEVRLSYAPGVCSMMCSYGGVNLYERRGTEQPRTILIPCGRRRRGITDGSAEAPASKHDGRESKPVQNADGNEDQCPKLRQLNCLLLRPPRDSQGRPPECLTGPKGKFWRPRERPHRHS